MSDSTDAKVRWLVNAAQIEDSVAHSVHRKHYAQSRAMAFNLRKMAREGLQDPDVIAGVPER